MVSWFGVVVAGWLAAERTRWALWLPVCLGVGVGGYFVLPWEPPGYVRLLAMAIVALTGWALRKSDGVALVVAIALATMASGFSIAQIRTVMVDAPMGR